MDGILPPTTRHKSWLQLIAEAYEKEHGPLPDPVSTAGSFLVTAPKTPVASYDMVGFDDEFVAILEEKLNGILWHQKLRRNLFGPVADTFPIGHTPPGFREPYFAERDKPIDTDSEDDDSPETQRILQKFSIIRTMKRVAMPRSPGFDKRNAKAKKRKVEDIRVREDLRGLSAPSLQTSS
ncbi:hypothetical protein QBC33DRAFT_282571 [Phialemonium atrogriseum]|uniref:Uncharacterized protein n=1 Tax=Phialemonium atrogriseum TaxID=1093897 RepID=A0AAJ0FIU3_9PEZI|nr:uncharacterized protein QBC33DRAFT_282571 [Phialemonium atrogriseum]KAK1762435.1 hypothetical protein QBC33DRAFT_282571 [Phialemonium atrogriseum]